MNYRHDRKETKIRVGISHGDTNGIGYEIIIKALQDGRMCELFTPIVYGSAKIATFHRKQLGITDFNFNIIKKAEQASPRKANLVNISEEEIKIELGQPTKEAGKMALLSLEQATKDLSNGKIDVLVTAPINKKNIQSETFHFPGHTEYLAQKFESPDHLMLMVAKNLRIGVITGHIPLKAVSNTLNPELICHKVKSLHDTLVRDFGIRKPKIALLGLNPHSGDEGLLGKEEQEIIIPAIEKVNAEGMMVFGPYPADGFFGSDVNKKFDGVLAMYHDQGMLPFKALSFNQGVNYTAGLPVIRTSPSHGTAYEIAGSNKASAESFVQAIFLAIDIFHNRALHAEITKNPLPLSGAGPKKALNPVYYPNIKSTGPGSNNTPYNQRKEGSRSKR